MRMPEEKTGSFDSWKGSSLALVFFVLVSVLMVGPHVLPQTQVSLLPYAHEDSNIFLWGLWWVKHCLLEGHDPYWTDFLFYPLGMSLAFHTLPIPYGLLSVPIQLLVGDVEGLIVALNSLIFLSFVLSGFGAYRLAFYVTGSRVGGGIAGLIFAFMPFHFLNMNCLNLLAIEVLPLYILSLLKLSGRPIIPQSIFVAGWLAFAFYTNLEYALYLLVFSTLWFVYHAGVQPYGVIRRRVLGSLALASFFFVVFASPLLMKQIPTMIRHHSAIKQDLDEVVFWSPAILSLITPSRFHPVYGNALSFAGDMENASMENWGMRSETSLGLIGLALAFAALLGRHRDGRIFYAVAALCFISLTLGPYLRVTGTWLTEVPMPYLFLYKYVPFFEEGRDPTRFTPLAVLMVSVLSAFAARDLLGGTGKKVARILLVTVLAGGIVFENMTRVAGGYRPEVNPLYYELGQLPGEFAIIDLTREPDKLLPQTVHEKRITYIEKVIPRTDSRNWMLPVEYDFRFPEEIWSLPPEVLASRISGHKAVMKNYSIRYAVLPKGPKAEMQLDLAIRLGARILVQGDLFLCAFEGDQAQPLQALLWGEDQLLHNRNENKETGQSPT